MLSRWVCVAVVVGVLVSAGIVWPGAVGAGNVQYDALWQQSGEPDFGAWILNGVAVPGSAAAAVARLNPRTGTTPRCRSEDIDGGSVLSADRARLCRGRDPMAAGRYLHGLNYYNGGRFYFGTMISLIQRVSQPIDHLIASWDAVTPPGTWIEVHVRVREGQRWTHWYDLPIWAADFSTIHRHSVNHQSDAFGGVDTDTFHTAPGHSTSTYQVEVTLFTTTLARSPSLRLLATVASHDAAQQAPAQPDRVVWGTDLAVPQRSQMLAAYRGLRFGGGGEAWCSPTSTSMVLAYWAERLRRPDLAVNVPTVAAGTYDATYDGTGNWPFNTAYAARFGLIAFVTRLDSMRQVEQWVRLRVPVVFSIAFGAGGLPGAPITSSDGHLLVVRGFTRTGDVITNDPSAATDSGVRTIYRRADLLRAWQSGSHGTVYIIYPAGWRTPL